MNPYMLPGSDPILMNQYNSPFYGQYSSFESAMNNPSNPLVNPVNSMNPVEYSQTLFGPWTTPMMTKTACLNCDEDKEKVNNNYRFQIILKSLKKYDSNSKKLHSFISKNFIEHKNQITGSNKINIHIDPISMI